MTNLVQTAFVTGAAGFVGAALCKRLLAEGWRVVGLDNLNDYYNPALKHARLEDIAAMPEAANFTFHKQDLVDRDALLELVTATKPEVIVHLAAQASVRYGLMHQIPYLESNLIGHFNMLAATKALADAGTPVAHFLYASSSSVYGARGHNKEEDVAFRETDDVSQPLSLYAATKVADELITHAWCNQFGLKASGLRFFTVYGPWGRPDMAPLMFTQAVLEGRTIPLYNKGDLWRDFTYIDDIVEAIVRLIPVPPSSHPAQVIYNLGNQNPVQVGTFVETLGRVLGKQPLVDPQDWPTTEVYKTHADTARLFKAVGWAPFTPLEKGLSQLAVWYRSTGEALLKA